RERHHGARLLHLRAGLQVLRRRLRLGAGDDHVRGGDDSHHHPARPPAEGCGTMTLTTRQLRILNRVCWTIALLVVAIPFVFPFLWMVSSGFKSATEIFGQPSLVPRVWRWENFIEVFQYQPFARQ